MSTSPITQGILDLLEKPAPPSPSPNRRRATVLSDHDLEQLNWLDVLKSPAAQKALDSHRLDDESLADWYSGATDAWDDWMKEHSN